MKKVCLRVVNEGKYKGCVVLEIQQERGRLTGRAMIASPSSNGYVDLNPFHCMWVDDFNHVSYEAVEFVCDRVIGAPSPQPTPLQLAGEKLLLSMAAEVRAAEACSSAREAANRATEDFRNAQNDVREVMRAGFVAAGIHEAEADRLTEPKKL